MSFKKMDELICEKKGKGKEYLFSPQWALLTSECNTFLQ